MKQNLKENSAQRGKAMNLKDIIDLQPVKLLQCLHIERNKYTNSDKEMMAVLVDKLVELGVYPKYGFNGHYSALRMVECWGVDWHQFSAPHYCPNCGTDLRDWEAGVPGKREIYVKFINNECNPYYRCPDCETDITAAVIAGCNGKNRLREKSEV